MLFFDLFRHDPNLVDVPAGEALFRAGDPGSSMYVLLSGQAEIRLGEQVVEELTPGTSVGELAVVDKLPRIATVVALSDCSFVEIDEKRFEFLVAQTPKFALEVMRTIGRRLRQCDLLVLERNG